jgi:hypothetical protein
LLSLLPAAAATAATAATVATVATVATAISQLHRQQKLVGGVVAHVDSDALLYKVNRKEAILIIEISVKGRSKVQIISDKRS